MNLKKMLQSSRCGKCKQERGHRFCLRRGQAIGWHCCNDLRVDRTCPETCSYCLSQKNDSLFLQAKVDSQKEFVDLLKKEMDYWIRKPQSVFNEQIPVLMKATETGKKELETFFEKVKFPEYVPIWYLFERLDLKIPAPVHKIDENPEEQAETFLDSLLQHDFEGTIPLLFHQETYENKTYKSAYIQRISKQKIITKMFDYSLLSCSTNEDKTQALVHFEINRKYDLTLLMKKREKWLVAAKIFGDTKHAISENEAVKQLAVYLSKRDFEAFLPLMEKYSAIFVDSADIYYYWSVYYTMNEQKGKAKEFLRIAIELDEDFTDAKYNYAFLMHIDNQLLEAEKWYRNILQSEPNDVKTLNNLASILIDRGEQEEAKLLLDKCLQIKPDFEIALQNRKRLGE